MSTHFTVWTDIHPSVHASPPFKYQPEYQATCKQNMLSQQIILPPYDYGIIGRDGRSSGSRLASEEPAVTIYRAFFYTEGSVYSTDHITC
jgi:hypothetical protein